MWSYAAEDTEADLARRYLSHARTAAAHSWAFVLAASSPEEYTHRETLMGDSFDKAVTAAVGDDVGYFLDTRVAMITELAEDFAVVQAQRAHEASLQAAAATKRAEAERRALQINAAFAELTKTASEVDEGVDDKNVTTTVPLQGGEDNSPTFMATRTAGAFDGPEDYGNDPYADKGDPFYVSYTCPKCGTTGSSRISDNSAGRPICHGCGNDIPADAITTGQRYLSSKSNVCPKCGTSVKATQDVDGKTLRAKCASCGWSGTKTKTARSGQSHPEDELINWGHTPENDDPELIDWSEEKNKRPIKAAKTAGERRGAPLEWTQGTTRVESYPGLTEDVLIWEAHSGDYDLMIFMHPVTGYTWSVYPASKDTEIASGPAMSLDTAKLAAEAAVPTETVGQMPLFAKRHEAIALDGWNVSTVGWDHEGEVKLNVFKFDPSVPEGPNQPRISHELDGTTYPTRGEAMAAAYAAGVARPSSLGKKAAWSEDDDEFDDDIPEECPQCGGPGRELGTLGHLAHYRCENCGWDWSKDWSDGDGQRYPQADDLSFESAKTAKRYQVWDNAAPKYSPGTPGTLVAEFDDLNLARRKLVEYGDWVGWDGVEMIDTQEGTPHQISGDTGPDIVVSSAKTASTADVCKNCRYPITLDGETWYHTRTGLVECQDKKPEPGPDEATPADK
jgi:predicted RNA-binding Zn-ribbon protein involved in translation (DUF1610 family)